MRLPLCLAMLVAGCAAQPAVAPHDAFFGRLSALCGKAFAGRVKADESADATFVGQLLVMHVQSCSADDVRIPFHVGDDRSRTWAVTRTADGLGLKHIHRHRDGSEDALSQCGGDTIMAGSTSR